MAISRDKVESFYDQLINEFPSPQDAILALEYLTSLALVASIGKLNKENLDSTCYRFSRNMTRRAKDLMDAHGPKVIADLRVIK